MARPGRKRKTGKREPNGRPQRTTKLETEMDILEVAVSARLRAGIPARLARSVGTLEGALFALHVENDYDKAVGISRDQYEAAVYYNEKRMLYLNALDDRNTPREPRKGPGSGDEDAHERFVATACEIWDEMREKVQERQNALGNRSNLFGALDALERGHLMEYQLGDLREALNAVDKYRTSCRKRAA